MGLLKEQVPSDGARAAIETADASFTYLSPPELTEPSLMYGKKPLFCKQRKGTLGNCNDDIVRVLITKLTVELKTQY